MKPADLDGKMLGFALPLLSARTKLGPCGEFPDLEAMAALASQWHMGIIQLLPVNDTGCQTSPYSALSAFALNPIFLRIGDLPELGPDYLSPGCTGLVKECRSAADGLAFEHREDRRVRYEAILDAKFRILRRLWAGVWGGWKSGSAPEASLLDSIRAWTEGRPWVKPYACFAQLKARESGKPWWEWQEHADPARTGIEELWKRPDLASDLLFWAWLQMRCSEQFASACAAAKAMGVEIMGDIPILLNADSADVWQQRELFDLDANAGAPPDMYAALGQNWGFPLYRWDAIASQDYRFWKERLSEANRYYSYYRIDHVLGFFRIWAIGKREMDGYLGRFEPERLLDYTELLALGFDAGRIRWLSQPHVSGNALREALSAFDAGKVESLRSGLFQRIGDEDLYLFAPSIRGGQDIASLLESPGSPAEESLLAWWRNRCLLEVRPGKFAVSWDYTASSAWRSLTDRERALLGGLIGRRRAESLALWEKTGRKILGVLSASVPMRPCAEDLGAVPPCVPAVLGELGIPGLRVMRWHRDYAAPGSPYVPLQDYPEASVACISVHDSSSMRQWWIDEAQREEAWKLAHAALGSAEPGQAPAALDAEAALVLLSALAASASRLVIHPLQDLLAASEEHREADPASERINVPGTLSPGNWTYRCKPSLEELAEDSGFAAKMRGLAALREPGKRARSQT